MDFSEWLVKRLQYLEWEQADLVKASGLSSTSISRFVNGDKVPGTLGTVRRLARALRVSEAELRAAMEGEAAVAEDAEIDRILARMRPQITSPELAELLVAVAEEIQRWSDRLARREAADARRLVGVRTPAEDAPPPRSLKESSPVSGMG